MMKHAHKWVSIRKGFPQKICMCGMLKVGTHTVLLGDEIRYTSTKIPTAAGQLGMDLATGRAQQFVGGVAQPIANTSDVGTGQALLAFGGDANPAETLDYFKAWKTSTPNTPIISNFERTVLINRPGTLANLRVKRALGGALAATVTVEVNGVATLISVALGVGVLTGGDTVNTVAVVAGDIVEVSRASVVGQSDSYVLSLGLS